MKIGGVTVNEVRGARGLAPWPVEKGGDANAKLPEAAPFGGFSDPPPVAMAEPAAPTGPAVEKGTEWRDTVDGDTLRVTAVGDGHVYFVDPEYVDPKSGPQPERQWRWRAATFLERCVPVTTAAGAEPGVTPPAPGGAPAASPLPESDGGGGPGVVSASLPEEAHGDLYALADPAIQAEALTGLGHPGILTAQAMLDGVPLWAEMRDALIAAADRAPPSQ